jgi:chromosome segregation ATPase
MDDPNTFNSVLQQYKDAYISVGMARSDPNTLDEPRNAIFGQIDRLQRMVNSENEEIQGFADSNRDSKSKVEQTASDANSLRARMENAANRLEVITRSYGDVSIPDWSPMYTRIKILGGLFIAVVAVQMMKPRAY